MSRRRSALEDSDESSATADEASRFNTSYSRASHSFQPVRQDDLLTRLRNSLGDGTAKPFLVYGAVALLIFVVGGLFIGAVTTHPTSTTTSSNVSGEDATSLLMRGDNILAQSQGTRSVNIASASDHLSQSRVNRPLQQLRTDNGERPVAEAIPGRGRPTNAQASMREKYEREDVPDVLYRERERFCQWWQSHRSFMRTTANQVMGNLLTYIINLNFDFSEDRIEYIKQLETWRMSIVSQPESDDAKRCHLECSHTEAEGTAPPEQMTHVFRQAIVACMMCVQSTVRTSDRCDVTDNSPFAIPSLAAGRLSEAFDRIYTNKADSPFYLSGGAFHAFTPYLSLIDSWVYSQQSLGSIFPLAERQSAVDVTSFREHGLDIATRPRALETRADGGIGGGMGVQMICKPRKDAPPLLLMSSGGGGGRGYRLDVEPLVNVPVAKTIDSSGKVLPVFARSSYAGLADPYKRECCNSVVHTCCDQESNSTKASSAIPSTLKMQADASQGGGGGIQVVFGPDPVTHQHRSDLDLFMGGGGGGGMAIHNTDFTESHGSQTDPVVNVPEDVDAFRRRFFRDLLNCLHHGDAPADAERPEVWIVGGGGVGGGVSLELNVPKTLGPDPALFRPASHAQQITAFASVSASAEVGMSFLLQVLPAWITNTPLRSLIPLSTSTVAYLESLHRRQDAPVGDIAGTTNSPSHVSPTSPPPPPPSSDSTLRTDPHAPSPYSSSIALFDSSEDMASGAADCVATCLRSHDGKYNPTSPLTTATTGILHHDNVEAQPLAQQLNHVASSSTSSSLPLFYAHCVCPCLQRRFSSRHWASYMSCTSLAIGTYDRSSRGHLHSAESAATVTVSTPSPNDPVPPTSPLTPHVADPDKAHEHKLRQQGWTPYTYNAVKKAVQAKNTNVLPHEAYPQAPGAPALVVSPFSGASASGGSLDAVLTRSLAEQEALEQTKAIQREQLLKLASEGKIDAAGADAIVNDIVSGKFFDDTEFAHVHGTQATQMKQSQQLSHDPSQPHSKEDAHRDYPIHEQTGQQQFNPEAFTAAQDMVTQLRTAAASIRAQADGLAT